MPKPRKFELIQCPHFGWRLTLRKGVYYADGRSNQPNPGRHSLGTTDRSEAMSLLTKLDFRRALKLGLAKSATPTATPIDDCPLTLDEGWQLYKKYIARPHLTTGPKPSTQKRYRAVFNKFLPFAMTQGAEMWNQVNADLVYSYVAHLLKRDYAPKTIRNEVVTILQAHKFLRGKDGNGRLRGVEKLEVKVYRVESERPYCYTKEEVAAIVNHCRANPKLHWLAHVIVALATTGLRIAELAGLRWTDIDMSSGMLLLTDESGHAAREGRTKRQTKSGRSRRLPIHGDLLATFEALPRRDAYAFHGPRGGRLKPDTVRQVLVRDVIKPLSVQFPTPNGAKGFADGRLHSFRHYFASACAINPEISQQTTMEWLGHADSEMTRHYFTLHDEQSKQQMSGLDVLGEAGEQRPGFQGAAINPKECAGRGSDPTIAT